MAQVIKDALIARSRDECIRPDLWPDHAWLPGLKQERNTIIRDLVGGNHAYSDSGVSIDVDGGIKTTLATRLRTFKAPYIGPSTTIVRCARGNNTALEIMYWDSYRVAGYWGEDDEGDPVWVSETCVAGRGIGIWWGNYAGFLTRYSSGTYAYDASLGVSSPYLPFNIQHTFAMTHDGMASNAGINLWINGASGTISRNSFSQTLNTSNSASIYSPITGLGGASSGSMTALYRWKRVMSASQVAEVSNDIILPMRRKRRVYSIPISAPLVTINADFSSTLEADMSLSSEASTTKQASFDADLSDSLSLSGSANITLQGEFTGTLPPLSVSSGAIYVEASMVRNCTFTGTLGGLQCHGGLTRQMMYKGAFSSALSAPLSLSASSQVKRQSTFTGTLPSPSMSARSQVTKYATFNGTLPVVFYLRGKGSWNVYAAFASTLSALSMSATAQREVYAAFLGSLGLTPEMTASGQLTRYAYTKGMKLPKFKMRATVDCAELHEDIDDMLIFQYGSTSNLIEVDLCDALGNPVTGLTNEDISMSYCRHGASSAVLVALTTGTAGTWAGDEDGYGFVEMPSMAGRYQISIPDAAFVSGAKYVTFRLSGAGFKTTTLTAHLWAVSPWDGIRMGMSALPSYGVGLANGLPVLNGSANLTSVVLSSGQLAAITGALSDMLIDTDVTLSEALKLIISESIGKAVVSGTDPYVIDYYATNGTTKLFTLTTTVGSGRTRVDA